LHAAAHRNQTLVVIAAVVMIVVAAEARRQHHITPTPSSHEPAACWTASRARRLFAGSSIGKHRSLVMATTASGLVPPIHFLHYREIQIMASPFISIIVTIKLRYGASNSITDDRE
jgi:hypothetical protein